jgi:hypothetical protein
MSLTVFPGLNRAPSDQMAEAPANPGSSQESTSAPSSESTTAPNDVQVDVFAGSEGDEGEGNTEETTPSASASPSASAKAQVEAVLSSPAVESLFNADFKSKVFVVDQSYTVLGDRGLAARFDFNPSSDDVFTNILVEVEIDSFVFEFEPVNRQLFTGSTSENLDVYMLVGDATYLYDEFGKKWSESELGKSKVKIEVVMEANGTTVKSISLALYTR